MVVSFFRWRIITYSYAWCEKCEDVGKKITYPKQGEFIGLEENANMLFNISNNTVIENIDDNLRLLSFLVFACRPFVVVDLPLSH